MNDEELIREAKKCTGCVGWLHRCKAECCKEFRASTKTVKKLKTMYIAYGKFTTDDQKYFNAHGCAIIGNKMLIPRCVTSYEGTDTIFHKKCDHLLRNNTCAVHGTNKQPDVCKIFDETTGEYKGTKGAKPYCTKNCLANYKVKTNENELK